MTTPSDPGVRVMRTIDITPTWSAIVRPMVDVLRNPGASDNAIDNIIAQFGRMADAADRYNELVCEQADAEGFSPSDRTVEP